MFNSINTLISLILGVVPSILWLLFWLREDRAKPEPKVRILSSFIAGMLAVIVVLPIEKTLYQVFSPLKITLLILILWAAVEEILKYLAAYFGGLRFKENDEPIDYIIYMISAALGFSALENAFFLTKMIQDGLITQSIINGNMRFIGATLLHTISSATVGVFLAFGFFKRKTPKFLSYLLTGLVSSIVLHSIFNALIMKWGEYIFFIFGGVWICIIILLVVFEKVKKITK